MSAETCLIKRNFALGQLNSRNFRHFQSWQDAEICMDAEIVQMSCGSYVSSHENQALKVWKAAKQVTTSAESRLIKRKFAFGIIISKISGIYTPGNMLQISMDAELVQMSCTSCVFNMSAMKMRLWKAAKRVTMSAEACLIKRNFALGQLDSQNFMHFQSWQDAEICMDAEIVQMSCASYVSKLFLLENEVLET